MNDKSHACDCPKDMPTQQCVRYCTGECDGPVDEAASATISEPKPERDDGITSAVTVPLCNGPTGECEPDCFAAQAVPPSSDPTALETVGDRLKRIYPEHYVRILNRMNTENGSKRTAELLYSDAVGHELEYLFLWARTPEGHEFWKALAKRERT